MRILQVALFVFGVLCLLGAVPFVGGVMGDALWRAGVAALLVDVVLILLWPRPERSPGH
jgi:preprotein translocase subunit SecF